MIVQKDIAEKLGISRAAVSSILSGSSQASKFRPEFRQKVLDTARKYGYQHNELARAVRSGHNNSIGFITQLMGDEYSGKLFDGVLDTIARKDYSSRIFTLREHREVPSIVQKIIGQRLAGIIIYNISQTDFIAEFSKSMKEYDIPIVIAGGSAPLKKGIRIINDTVQGGRLAFEHLYSLGHRHMLLAASYSWTGYSRNLQQGFLEAGQKAGEKTDLHLLGSDGNLDLTEILQELRKNRETAVFCNNSFTALRVITALQKNGIRVPEDISIMARGNLHFCDYTEPGITVLDESLYQIGCRAGELLLEAITAPSEKSTEEIIPHRLIIRGSTAAVPASRQKPLPL